MPWSVYNGVKSFRRVLAERFDLPRRTSGQVKTVLLCGLCGESSNPYRPGDSLVPELKQQSNMIIGSGQKRFGGLNIYFRGLFCKQLQKSAGVARGKGGKKPLISYFGEASCFYLLIRIIHRNDL
jgi:hypothetical protein